MSDKVVKNARELPTVWYGKHFSPGVAEYATPGEQPYRIFLNEDTIRKMDASFQGRPVYVDHVQEVDLANIEKTADGYVVESFYNEADSCHWVKFLAITDKAMHAIRGGYRLSNAYVPTGFGPGGMSKGVEYAREVTSAEYEHLALVADPRYEDSIILTPSQFKEYNTNKRLQLSQVTNSKTGKISMFSFFKKTKVENSADLVDMVVKLPNTGEEVSIGDLIARVDVVKAQPAVKNAEDKAEHGEAKSEGKEVAMAEEKHGEKAEHKGAAPAMANMDHHIMLGNRMHKLAHLKNMLDGLYCAAEDGGEKDAMAAEASADKTKTNADQDGGEKDAVKAEKEEDKTKRNDGDPVETQPTSGVLGNADEDPAEKKAEGEGWDRTKRNDFFNALADAPLKATAKSDVNFDMSSFARGKARYGSQD